MRFFFTTVSLLLAAVSTIHAYPVHHQPRAFKHNDLEARAAIDTLLYNRDLGLIDVYARIDDASEYYRARNLPLRDDIESELVRRSAKGKAGTPAKGKGKAPAAPHKSSVKVGAKTQPKKMPVAWRPKAAHDASQPLAGTWQHGQHATVMHEAIVRNHGKHNVPGAKSAQIL
ncbi:hypothetical protein C8Q75DRAFT_603295 [Abortiporus biennis]|nr:hypothetical protein C8Q75DRAFT_603295 [Abortiporus biennis]